MTKIMTFPQIALYKFFTSLVLLICVGVMAISSAAQVAGLSKSDDLAPEAAVAPIFFSHANLTCADLNAIPNDQYGGAFTKIVDDDQLKLDSGTPNGTYPFANIGIAQIKGNPPAGPTRTVTISSTINGVTSFNSQVQILAVNVKISNDSYVYSYAYPNSPVTYSDTDLVPIPLVQGLSHVTFCYGLAANPSAAQASIGGRVVNSFGYGIRGARITVTNTGDGTTNMVLTNPFGYYAVADLPVGEFYFATVSHKRYAFADNTRTFTLDQDLGGLDFIANP